MDHILVHFKKLQRMQNFAARVVEKDFDYVNTRGINLIKKLNWQTLQERKRYLLSTLMYKCVNQQAPRYLTDNITLVSEYSERLTRQTDSLNVVIPKPFIDKFKESFLYTGAKQWNSLEIGLKRSQSAKKFKKEYKQIYWAAM